MEIETQNAYVEVLEILKYISIYDYLKIPKHIIEFLKDNSNTNYVFKFDGSKTLDEQNVSKKTKQLILILYRDYWATEEQKRELIRKQIEAEIYNEKEKIKKYEKKELFRKKKDLYKIQENNYEEQSNLVISNKNNLFARIFNFFKKISFKKSFKM